MSDNIVDDMEGGAMLRADTNKKIVGSSPNELIASESRSQRFHGKK
jgi:hypothetical protein